MYFLYNKYYIYNTVLYYPHDTNYLIFNIYFIYPSRMVFNIIYNFSNICKSFNKEIFRLLLISILRAIICLLIIGIPRIYIILIYNSVLYGVNRAWLNLSSYINIKIIIINGKTIMNGSRIRKEELKRIDELAHKAKKIINPISGMCPTGRIDHATLINPKTGIGSVLTHHWDKHPLGKVFDGEGVVTEKFSENITQDKIIPVSEMSDGNMKNWIVNKGIHHIIKSHKIVHEAEENSNIIMNTIKNDKFKQEIIRLDNDTRKMASDFTMIKEISEYNKIEEDVLDLIKDSKQLNNLLNNLNQDNAENYNYRKGIIINKKENIDIYNKLETVYETDKYHNNIEIKLLLEDLYNHFK